MPPAGRPRMRAASTSLARVCTLLAIVGSLTGSIQKENKLGRAAMNVQVPRALWDELVNFDAQVWDGAASCTPSGFGLVQGGAQMEQHQMFEKAGGQASFNVTAGIPNVYYVAGYDMTGALIAAGCQRATVDP